MSSNVHQDEIGSADDPGLQTFSAQLQQRVAAGRTRAGTARAYLTDVRQFAAYLDTQGLRTTEATPVHVRHYLAHLAARQQPGTVRRKFVSLHRYYVTLRESDEGQHDPTESVKLPRQRGKRLRRSPLTAPTIRRLLAAPRLSTVKGVRDRALLACQVLHGLTIAEACRLDVGAVDLGAGALHVVGRGERTRTVALTPQTTDELRRWLAARSLLQPATEALFISLHWTRGRAQPGGRLSLRGARRMVDGYLAQVGAKQAGVSCQALRHAYTVLALAGGADLRAVARSLGHASTATTEAYVEDVGLARENPALYLVGLL